MKAKEFIVESTALELNTGETVAVRSSLGKVNGGGQRITMMVTKDEWDAIKNQQANTEMQEYDLATADTIVKDWLSRPNVRIKWKTAADFNKDARDLEQHRFRNDPEVQGHFDATIG